MDTASLLLLVCAAGVNTGWQPDQDAADAYEFAVAIDPETAQRLTTGETPAIELTIPDDLQRLSKIRVTVADKQLPRQQRVTALKPPLPEGRVEAQIYQPAGVGDPRYATPPAGNFDPYATSSQPQPQPTAEQMFGGSPRYPGAPGSTTAPTSSSGPAPIAVGDYAQGVVDGYTQSARASAAQWQADAQNQLRTGVQDATAPVRDAFEQVDDRFRTAIGSLGDQSREVLQGAIQPLGGQGLFRADSATRETQPMGPPWAPAASAPHSANAAANPNAAWPTATTPTTPSPTVARNAAAGAPDPASGWPPAPSPFASGGGGQPGGSPPTLATPPNWDGRTAGQPTPASAADPRSAYPSQYQATQPAPTPSQQRERIDRPIDPRDAGQWTGAQPSGPIVSVGGERYGATAGAVAQGSSQPGQPSSLPTQPTGQGAASWPADWPRYGAEGSPRTAAQPTAVPGYDGVGPRFPDYTSSPAAAAGATSPTGQGGPPAVTSDMLAGSGSQPLDGDSPAAWPPQRDASAAAAGAPRDNANPAPAQPGTEKPSLGASAFGWDTSSNDGPPAQQPIDANPPSAESSRTFIPVIVAWTLLFSSVAGNAYLLWSYMEVRAKYRTVVRRGGQGVRSRFTAA